MKPSLQIKQSLQLVMTPQLQQAIKFLQLSTLEMNQEIEHYLLENPLLEREDDAPAFRANDVALPGSDESEHDAGEYVREDQEDRVDSGEFREEPHTELAPSEIEEDRWFQDSGSYGSGSRRDHDDDDGVEAHDLQAAATTLRDHLEWQLGLSQFSDRDKSLVRFLIEGLNDDGYLSASLPELLETIPPEYEVEADDLEIALRQLQSLDPTGIGARTLRECLALQLKAEPASLARDLAFVIVDRHLDLLAGREFNRLIRLLKCNDEALKAARELIVSLDPRPGARFAVLDTRYIIPDVFVKKVRGCWMAQINPDAFPKLRVNRLYAGILAHQKRGSESRLSAQLQEARWLIKSVQQRFDTIARVSQTIVDRQCQFFEHGEVAMRPLVLREIADAVSLHESTVSRVTNQKYMATPRGIFELKYFFGSHVSTDSGGVCSAIAIRALIKQLIGGENSKKPLSDSQISEILAQQGIVVARRTVAKYRESLNIPPSHLRKTL
jgi:RNA polymerase sigma-54 factor